MDYNEDSILGEVFSQNPYEYLQNYIRNMNNQIFLSEYQINNLYALLLIGRASPWDSLRTSTPNYKSEVNELVEKKIKQVKYLLDNMSQLYEDKVKKATFNQIERLMSILKAKNKSIYIQKYMGDKQSPQQLSIIRNQNHIQQQRPQSILQQLTRKHSNQPGQGHQCEKHRSDSEKEERVVRKSSRQALSQKLQQIHKPQQRQDALQVFGLIQGIGNIPNLSAMALGNCLQYNTSQRYIKFKMTKNYIMTIKNEDQVSYDLTSRISKVPACVFVNHIFPYLTAWELFRARSVCREWFGLVKDSWHATFKRQMYIQLLAGQFCKDIEFFYKCIQLRNPFFQKLSLLLHALIQIIEWQTVTQAVEENRLNAPCKRVLIVLLKLLGQNIPISNFNDLNEELWQQHKSKVPGLRDRVVEFFSNFSGNSMTINQLRSLKINILDHAFMRGDEMQTQEKTPLLLLIFIKQLNLQQILKNHLHFSQEYMLNSKNRLDSLSAKMPHQRGFLEGVYKILLLKSMNNGSSKEEEQGQDDKHMPNFQEMLKSIIQGTETDKPDFCIKTKSSKTSIYMDRATKLDIIISTVRKSYGKQTKDTHQEQDQQGQSVQRNGEQVGQHIERQMIQKQEQNQNAFQQQNKGTTKQQVTHNTNMTNSHKDQESNQDTLNTKTFGQNSTKLGYTSNMNSQNEDKAKQNDKYRQL